MPNRGTLYISLLLIVAGLYLLLVNLLGPLSGLGLRQMWPGFLLLGALACYLPMIIWREHRPALAGLAVPGTVFLVSALLLYYSAITSDWKAWAYLWPLELSGVGLGLLFTWLAGPRRPQLLPGALTTGLIGLFLFATLALVFGAGPARILASIVLIGLGLYLLLRGLLGRVAGRPRFEM